MLPEFFLVITAHIVFLMLFANVVSLAIKGKNRPVVFPSVIALTSYFAFLITGDLELAIDPIGAVFLLTVYGALVSRSGHRPDERYFGTGYFYLFVAWANSLRLVIIGPSFIHSLFLMIAIAGFVLVFVVVIFVLLKFEKYRQPVANATVALSSAGLFILFIAFHDGALQYWSAASLSLLCLVCSTYLMVSGKILMTGD